MARFCSVLPFPTRTSRGLCRAWCPSVHRCDVLISLSVICEPCLFHDLKADSNNHGGVCHPKTIQKCSAKPATGDQHKKRRDHMAVVQRSEALWGEKKNTFKRKSIYAASLTYGCVGGSQNGRRPSAFSLKASNRETLRKRQTHMAPPPTPKWLLPNLP